MLIEIPKPFFFYLLEHCVCIDASLRHDCIETCVVAIFEAETFLTRFLHVCCPIFASRAYMASFMATAFDLLVQDASVAA